MQVTNKKTAKSGLILALTLLISTSIQSQSAYWDQLEWRLGTSTINQLGYGGFYTDKGAHFEDAYTTVPSLGIAYRFHPKYSLGLQFQYSVLMAEDEGLEMEDYRFIANSSYSWQIALHRSIQNFQLGICLSGIQNSYWATNFRLTGSFWHRAGPGLSLGYTYGNTSVFLSKDMFYDFSRWSNTFYEEYLNLRILKHFPLYRQNSPKTLDAKTETKTELLEMGFGAEVYVDHYFGSIVNPGIFSDLGLNLGDWGLFTKRALTLKYLPENPDGSYYTATANWGIRYRIDETARFGISYLAARDKLQRRWQESLGLEGRAGLVNVRGFSLHYYHKVNNKWDITSQYDILCSGIVQNRFNYLAELVLRVGLMRKI